MTPRPRVLLAQPLAHIDGDTLLRSRAEVVEPVSIEPTSLAEAIVDVDAMITRAPARFSAPVISCGERLRVIGLMGSGTDSVDVEAAARRGIVVVTGAGVAPRAVAEYTIAAMVWAHRGMRELHRATTAGEVDWPTRFLAHQGTELTGTTLGIVGLGHIGRRVADVAAAAFGMEVLAFDPYVSGPVGAVQLVGLHELLDRSLTVSIHVPLLPETRGLLGRDELVRIGPSGVLVHVARGGVVDEQALVDVLERGDLKAAVVDVFDGEPPGAERLARLGSVPGLTLTPHVAGVTDQAARAASVSVVEQVLAVVGAGGGPRDARSGAGASGA